MFQGLRAHHASEAAAAMAYSMFLSLFPLLACLGYALSLLVRSESLQSAISPLLAAAPEAVSRLISSEAAGLAASDGAHRVAPVAAFGFFFIASSGVAGLMNVVALTAGGLPRSWWHTRILAFLFVIAALTTVTATGTLILNLGLSGAQNYRSAQVGPSQDSAPLPHAAQPPLPAPAVTTARSLGGGSASEALVAVARTSGIAATRVRFWITPSQRHALTLAGLVLGILGVAAFYRVAVDRPSTLRRRLLPGATLAVSAWVIVTWGFGIYVSRLASYSLYYGGLAAIAMLLFWCWLTALALIVGAELNAQLEGIRDMPRARARAVNLAKVAAPPAPVVATVGRVTQAAEPPRRSELRDADEPAPASSPRPKVLH
jgi:uncharacterized BrkB/YihY/UPF0761 family membrane protein